MLEQKLFFTRNGEYTIWEKIDNLEEHNLDLIIGYIENKIKRPFEEEILEKAQKKSYIYKICKKQENAEDIEEKINEYFNDECANRLDFNAVLYKLDLSYIDIDLACEKLEKLSEKNDDYDIENIKINIFYRKFLNCIDIRLSSSKISSYKDNSNEQFINTELRIYFDLGLVVMTDYSDYTHNRKVKEKLLENIAILLTGNFNNIISYKLSDMTLRFLLKKSRKYASKFTFQVDEYLNVNFDVSENIGDNPLEHSSLKEFYEKHPISAIKILMNSDEDKYITIDGERGKLISRSKNMKVEDVDEFIKLLKDVVKYDYLNFDYKKDIKDIARRKLIGHTMHIQSLINNMYTEIEEKISQYLEDKNDVETIVLTKNTLFYCLINKKKVSNDGKLSYKLDEKITKLLTKLLDIKSATINEIFNKLILLAINNNDNLLEAFDNFINLKGELNVNEI